MANQLGLWHAP